MSSFSPNRWINRRLLTIGVSSRRSYTAALLGLLLVTIAASSLLARQHIELGTLGKYHVYQCQTGGVTSAPVFDLLAVSSHRARKVADHLCAASPMAEYYGAVRIDWQPRGQLSAKDILNETYDLIWSREHTMAGLVPEYASYYEPLLHYDHYQVYWFSRGAPPRLTPAYFHGKRIGLLNDRQSHTMYLLPLASLKEAGIDFSAEELVYFDDAPSLYGAFARGELDLVSGGLFLEQDLDIPLSRTLIAGNATAATLFVRKDRPTEVDCAVASALDQFTGEYLRSQRAFAGGQRCEF
ncbi:hypothetical protein [Microbulbifer sp.]|uniref:hypothetical protein n=1 Tax=Microbulbifer sp. TaxID=1908541 RepID=UPI0025826DAC|nr:hypothetical protein [Microbulbifer sp.]